MVLVDTSIWIEFLERKNSPVRKDVEQLLRRGEVATAGLVLAELRQGCRSPTQVGLILNAMEPLVYFEADRNAWRQAGELAASATARGQQVELGDCLLAALALRENCAIFSLDRDFERIPRLELYQPRG